MAMITIFPCDLFIPERIFEEFFLWKAFFCIFGFLVLKLAVS